MKLSKLHSKFLKKKSEISRRDCAEQKIYQINFLRKTKKENIADLNINI